MYKWVIPSDFIRSLIYLTGNTKSVTQEALVGTYILGGQCQIYVYLHTALSSIFLTDKKHLFFFVTVKHLDDGCKYKCKYEGELMLSID